MSAPSNTATAASNAAIRPSSDDRKIPVVLLKTKSSPTDGYEEFFAAAGDGRYDPVFVPVLEHRFRPDALKQLRADIAHGGFTGGVNGVRANGSGSVAPQQHSNAKYGAIIFTSQRAVEAFTQVVQDLRRERNLEIDALLPPSLPLYVVGPATARGLLALGLPCPVLGEESGTGEVLAKLILEDYNSRAAVSTTTSTTNSTGKGKGKGSSETKKLPILFLVGEQRRDIIPKTLQAPDLAAERYTAVDEVVVYETAEMASFRQDFAAVVARNKQAGAEQQWVVVFSPTGGKAMLETLGKGEGEDNPTTASLQEDEGFKTWIATIGPTTRDYLLKCGYESDVCAKKPSPEGVGNGIEDFMHGFAAH